MIETRAPEALSTLAGARRVAAPRLGPQRSHQNAMSWGAGSATTKRRLTRARRDRQIHHVHVRSFEDVTWVPTNKA